MPNLNLPVNRAVRVFTQTTPASIPRLQISTCRSSPRSLFVPAIVGSIQRRQTSSSSTSNNDVATSRRPSNFSQKLPDPERAPLRHPTFDVVGKVYVVTGGARGLGLTMAEALAENGAHVYCLDRLPEPSEDYHAVDARITTSNHGSMTYRQIDVRSANDLEMVVESIASKHQRLDGLAAAAGIQNVVPALDYPPDKIDEMLQVNYKGVYLSAVACARQMVRYQTPGAMMLVGSTSGMNAIKGFTASVYCSAKAGVIQLTRSLAMEWGKAVDGRSIRVNCLSPGNTLTPMVRNDFKNDPNLRETWERENMMGRIGEPEEYKGATLFLLSDASSFMTGANLVIDGGYTAW